MPQGLFFSAAGNQRAGNFGAGSKEHGYTTMRSERVIFSPLKTPRGGWRVFKTRNQYTSWRCWSASDFTYRGTKQTTDASPWSHQSGMMWIFFAAFFMSAFFMSSSAVATQVSEHDIYIDVGQNGVSHINAEVNYADLTTDKVSYLVLARVENVTATDGAGYLSCALIRQNYGTEISCTPNNLSQKNYSVGFSFEAYSLVSASDTASLLSYNYAVSDPTDALHFEVVLPEATGVISSSGFEPIFPPGWMLGSTGRRTKVFWIIDKPDLGKTYTFNVNYEPIAPSTPSVLNVNYVLIAIIAVLLILIVFFRFRVPGSIVRTVMSVLKPDEKKVLDAVAQKGGQCKQRDIVKLTDFSKAKVSRIVSDLETRGIIEKMRTGRSNRIQVAKHPSAKPEDQKK